MNSIQIVLLILMSLSGFPIGKFIAKHTEEELKDGRKWFLAIISICILSIILFSFFVEGESLVFLISSLIFILLISFASLKK